MLVMMGEKSSAANMRPVQGGEMKAFIGMAHKLALVIIMVITMLGPLEVSAAGKNKSSEGPQFLKPIKTPQSWYADQVDAGKNVYLSANYIFQATKLRTQQNLLEYEQSTLYPLLKDLCGQMTKMGLKGDALIFVEMAGKLLDPEVETQPDIADKVAEKVSAFENDPQNTPRGHYASSEELSRYFRGMQFLAKATFNVRINEQWFAQRLYMLFPLEAAVEILTTVSNPDNKEILDKIDQISNFYERLVGPADLPTFQGLIRDDVALTVDDLVSYSKSKGMPRINRGMGVGVQFLGERFSAHQMVIDNLSETFLANDPKVNRAKAFEVLQVNKVFFGRTSGKTKVTGLIKTVPKSDDTRASFYDLCLGAIIELPVRSSSNYSVNTGAACLTALAEQTILVTKQSTLVPKSTLTEEAPIKKPVKIYVQPNLQNFLKRLSQADRTISSLCGQEPLNKFYDTLIKVSRSGKPVDSNSPEGAVLMGELASLPVDPTVTADIFYFAGATDKGFLHWSIGPFEVEYPLKDGTAAKGMEMVFFEGWNDTVLKELKTPLTNEQWRDVFLKGDYKKFKSVIKMP